MEEFVRNCRLCKAPMESSPFTMCSACLNESEQVRQFISKHPLVSIEEISRTTGITFDKVEQMVELGLNHKDKVMKQ